ncbi:phage tail spike protein [Clostridium perfringens]|uniref:phage tail spike protein n=1 Tax=Clostridium perfringens TaxID=1502 RepID=UPI001ABA4333|nr:phage tail spike protein [Clostridium perfringens]MBO3420201.1 phage tail protein [Clostridium perfringens]
MLQLYNKNKKKIAALTECENLCIESILESGDKTLSFYYSIFNKFYDEIEEETYIRTKTDEYVVKAKGGDSNENKTLFTCKLNIEELEGTTFDRFESVEQNLVDALNLAIVGTGWRLNSESCTNRKKRTIRMTNCSSWTIIQTAKKLYDIEFKFDTFNKVIMLFDRIGEDRGVYFTDSLNLRALQVQGNSYGFYTRIIPLGKDGLTIASVNGGKIYLENKQYSNKTLTYYWKDERYTKPESLKEDALEKLNVMSKPFKSYIASTINLAEMNEKYKDILEYNLGDYIYLVSKKNKVKDKHRIVKTKEYPDDHSKDTVELANKSLDLSEEKLLIEEMSTTLDNVTTDNGTLNGSTIDSIQVSQIEDFKANVIQVTDLTAINARIDNLHAIKADIQDLNAVKANIGTLEATKANITELNAVKADLQQAIIAKANITDLNAAVGKINVLESKTGNIENLLAGNLTANNFKANSITASSGIIANGAIGDAEISSLSGNKLRFGTIDTGLVTVSGPNGRLKILGNRLQIFDDVNNRLFERIMLGINDKNRASLTLRGADGQTVLLTEEGLTKAGITDGFGKADDNSLSALKLDKNSIVRQVNGATETIAGTRIQVGDRTLDVELSTQNNTITEHSKELSSQKTSINALDNALKLKVDEQVYRDSINTINDNISTTNSNLSKATTELNLLKGEVGSKVNKTDIDKTVKEIEDKIKINTDKIATTESSFTQKTNEIKANVSNLESETTTKIINAKNEAINESRGILDTRKDNQNPEWYMSNYPRKTISEFKYANVIGIPNAKAIYGVLETKIPWDNPSGGYPTQVFRSNSFPTYQRHGVDNATWSNWEQIEDTKGSQDKANGALENSKAYTNSQITVVNTKVCNLESGIDILKDQIKSKVSQSDIDKSITTVDNKIKLVDSKISDVSSSVIQLKDSVETSINSINSKTQSLETSLNGKVSKQELTVVDNKVANIKASLDGVTQRVSSTESKTQTLEHNINDKASKQEVVNLNSKVVDITANLNGITQRVSSTETFTKSLNDKLWETTNKLNNVEQRITPTSIINMVSSSYYQKGEANNLFSTKSEVEQLDNRINYRFSNTGYSNLIFNGNFANGTVHWRNWGNCSLISENGQLLVRAKQSSEKANMGAVSSTFVLEKGKKYSLSFQGASCWNIPWLNYIYLLGEDGVNYRLDLNFDVNSADLVYRTATFTAPETKWVRLLIGIEGYLQTDISGFKLVDVCLVEGDIPRRFIPNANEISEGSTSIDSNGVIVRHSNDSYTSMTHGGFEWKTKGMSKAYHCLAETGWVNISTGAWLGDHYDIKITLPEYFKGKVFTPCSMIQGWYVESNFSLNQLVVNIPYETINYSEGSFVIRVKALTRDGTFQRNINISWLAIA